MSSITITATVTIIVTVLPKVNKKINPGTLAVNYSRGKVGASAGRNATVK